MRMARVLSVGVPLALCLVFGVADANTSDRPSISAVDIGRSNDGADFLRVGQRRPFRRLLYFSDSMTVSGYSELSLNLWSGDRDSTVGIAFSPVFVASFCEVCTYTPYVELGVGVALISSTKIKERDMSSLFQFEDRIGVGIKTPNLDVHFRYMHYSNAGTVSPNDGIDLFVLGFTFAR